MDISSQNNEIHEMKSSVEVELVFYKRTWIVSTCREHQLLSVSDSYTLVDPTSCQQNQMMRSLIKQVQILIVQDHHWEIENFVTYNHERSWFPEEWLRKRKYNWENRKKKELKCLSRYMHFFNLVESVHICPNYLFIQNKRHLIWHALSYFGCWWVCVCSTFYLKSPMNVILDFIWAYR